MSTQSIRAQKAAHTKWAKIKAEDRPKATQAARDAFNEKWLELADGCPKRAKNLRAAFFADLALKSADARKRRKAAS